MNESCFTSREASGFMETEFLGVDGLEELLLTSRDAAHTLLSRWKISCVKRRHGLLFDRSEILRWLEAQRHVTTREALEVVEA